MCSLRGCLMKGKCAWCGKEFEYEKKGREKRYCCQEHYRKAHNEKTKKRYLSGSRVCVRCGVEKPIPDFGTKQRACKECQKIKTRVCTTCGKEKEFRYFTGTMTKCKSCVEVSSKKMNANSSGGKYNTCHGCEHLLGCSWLVQAKLAPLCFSFDDDNDPHYLSLLPEEEREYALALMEGRL